MSLTITYPKTHEAWSGGGGICGSGGTSATRNVPAKMLVADKDGHLIPCNYQYWFWGDDHGVGSGNHYVPFGERPVDPEALSVIKKVSFESEVSEGKGFHDFIHNLMHEPPTSVQFIKYDGVDEVVPPQEHWRILGIKIAKRQRTHFLHRFSLCRLRAPLDEEYEARIAEKKRQASARKSNLERLEQELSPLSLSTYLEVSGQEIKTFDIVPIEHSEEKTIPSGGSLSSIDELLKLAMRNFVKKTPYQTDCVVAVQKEIVEIPSTFWVRGKQRITYRGVALVPKKEDH